MSIVEWIAATFAVAYLFLAVAGRRVCWIPYLISCALYIPVFYTSKMYFYAGLQVLFAILGLRGWFAWKGQGEEQEAVIRKLPDYMHLVVIGLASSIGFALGYFGPLLGSGLALARADAMLSTFSIASSILSSGKFIQSWLYWSAINSVAVFLFWSQELWATLCLTVINLVFSIVGYIKWQKALGVAVVSEIT